MATTTILFVHGVNTRHEEVGEYQRHLQSVLPSKFGGEWQIETLSWEDFATPQTFEAQSFQQHIDYGGSNVFSYGASVSLDAQMIAEAVKSADPSNLGQFKHHVSSFVTNIGKEKRIDILRSVAASIDLDYLEKCLHHIFNEAYIPADEYRKKVSWRKYIADLITVIVDDHENCIRLKSISCKNLESIRSVVFDSLSSLGEFEKAGYFPTEHRSVLLKNAKELIHDLAKEFLQEKLISLAKKESAFLGDIISYFAMRDQIEGRLEERIRALLDTSKQLVLLGHSLGGVILAKLLVSGSTRLPPTLITMGTQVGLLAELGFFGWNHPGKIVVEDIRWLNIYDASDPLSFPIKQAFDPVEDFKIFTGLPERAAHGQYFYDEAVLEKISTFCKSES